MSELGRPVTGEAPYCHKHNEYLNGKNQCFKCEEVDDRLALLEKLVGDALEFVEENEYSYFDQDRECEICDSCHVKRDEEHDPQCYIGKLKDKLSLSIQKKGGV